MPVSSHQTELLKNMFMISGNLKKFTFRMRNNFIKIYNEYASFIVLTVRGIFFILAAYAFISYDSMPDYFYDSMLDYSGLMNS